MPIALKGERTADLKRRPILAFLEALGGYGLMPSVGALSVPATAAKATSAAPGLMAAIRSALGVGERAASAPGLKPAAGRVGARMIPPSVEAEQITDLVRGAELGKPRVYAGRRVGMTDIDWSNEVAQLADLKTFAATPGGKKLHDLTLEMFGDVVWPAAKQSLPAEANLRYAGWARHPGASAFVEGQSAQFFTDPVGSAANITMRAKSLGVSPDLLWLAHNLETIAHETVHAGPQFRHGVGASRFPSVTRPGRMLSHGEAFDVAREAVEADVPIETLLQEAGKRLSREELADMYSDAMRAAGQPVPTLNRSVPFTSQDIQLAVQDVKEFTGSLRAPRVGPSVAGRANLEAMHARNPFQLPSTEAPGPSLLAEIERLPPGEMPELGRGRPIPITARRRIQARRILNAEEGR